MATLADLFADQSLALQTRLDQAPSLQDAIGAQQEELLRLAAAEGPYMRQNNVVQTRCAALILVALQQALESVKILDHGAQPPQDQANRGSLRVDGSQVGAIIGAGAGALVLGPAGAALGAGLGATAGRVVDRSIRPAPAPHAVRTAERGSGSQAASALARMYEALQLADQAVETVRVPDESSRARPLLSGQRELLELIQRLLGESMDPQATLTPTMRARFQELREHLRREQIQVVSYEPAGMAAEMDERFDFEPSIDPAQEGFLTLLPALIDSRGGVLLTGRVVLPGSSSAASNGSGK